MTAAIDTPEASPAPGPKGLAAVLGPVLGLIRSKAFQPAAVAVFTLLVLFAIPARFDPYWISNFTLAAIMATVTCSTGFLYGRVGLVSLGQVAPYGIGTWVTMRLAHATDLPFIVLILIGGLAAMVIGVLIGLPALRVSGLYLALVTLMLVAGVAIVLFNLQFPNGGTGFRGGVEDLSKIVDMRRPRFATDMVDGKVVWDDVAYFRFVVIVALILIVGAWFALSRKPGRAWASIRQSEAAALAAGIDVTRYKVYAFALASFMAGVGGGLFSATIKRGMSVDSFTSVAAVFVIAAVIMGGIYSLWGGVLAGFLATCLVKFLNQNIAPHDFWNDFSLSLFGFGLLMNIVQGTKKAEKKGVEA